MAHNSQICPICFEPNEDNQDRLTLACSHVFHLACWLKYVEQSSSQQSAARIGPFAFIQYKCPYCRQNVSPQVSTLYAVSNTYSRIIDKFTRLLNNIGLL